MGLGQHSFKFVDSACLSYNTSKYNSFCYFPLHSHKIIRTEKKLDLKPFSVQSVTGFEM